MFTIDNKTWNVNIRKFPIESNATMNEKQETSGTTISGKDLPDFTGTSLEFDIPIDTRNLSQDPDDDENSVHAFYAKITDPNAIHSISVPINGIFTTRNAKITSVHRVDYVDGNGSNRIIYSTIDKIHVVLQNYWRKPQ